MKILIADDNPLDLSVLKITLEKWDYEIVECADGDSALEILKKDDAPPIALLDWMMPGKSGPEICEEVRMNNAKRYTYLMLLTSKDDTEDVIQGMKSGADDYIAKPVNMHELQVRLRAGRRIIELQEELIDAREALRTQATRDFLTGIWNRSALMDIMVKEFDRAARSQDPIGIIMCDIDHFKRINDTHGHQAGDVVLKEAAQRMEKSLRAYDCIGRYGGEEFLIMAPGCDSTTTQEVAERIRIAISEAPFMVDNTSLDVTISLGAISETLNRDTHPDDLIGRADKALYKAKESGRNRVVCYEQALSS
ncbi:MAG: diguanylate cyclase response regulator [Candidatus Hydrogenedentota bacterium]|nr:MAG: diguanylate cyclase response regulator [Candidatus Hydrogenedentota bacterium]